MSLRFRLSLLLALISLVVVLLFGVLAYGLFVRQQMGQLELLLNQDLLRAQTLFSDPSVGVSLSELAVDGFQQQFVTSAGVVTIPPDVREALPLVERASLVRLESGPALVAAVPWETSSGLTLGTIRASLDMNAAFAARRALASSLLLSGLVISTLALLGGLGILRRALRPLVRLAHQARLIDPAHPQLADYTGPNDEVGDVAHALNAALENVRERQLSERAALAEIAHELAAPLTLVSGHLESLTARINEPDLQVAKNAADELLYTSQDLLTLARGELERSLNLQVFELSEVLERVVASYKGVRLELIGPAQLAGSPERITQLVRNLVRNAVQAADNPSEVKVGLEPGVIHCIFVEDTGQGIDAADLPHIFDRFYTKRGGAGVGLSVAKRIAQAHGGDIEVSSVLGQGTQFRVTLPSLEEQLEA